MKTGDVIVKLDDKDVADPPSLRNLTASLDVGPQVPVTFYREGEQQTVTVTIAELPDCARGADVLGFRVRSRPAGERKGDGPRDRPGRPGSPAFQAGLRPGMRILGRRPAARPDAGRVRGRRPKVDLDRGLPLVILAGDGRPRMVLIGGRGPAAGRAAAAGNVDGDRAARRTDPAP